MRLLLTILAALATTLNGTTLEKLTFDEMVAKSTQIVRGRVTLSNVQQHGPIFYSHYKMQVSEQYKGPAAKMIDVVLPGGTIGRSQQTFSGVPSFPADADVVLFLWTSKAGLTHIIGLSQDGAALSLEPGGQFELSGAPLKTIHETCTETNTHRHQVREVCAEIGAGCLGVGFAPTWSLAVHRCPLSSP
mgnify:CR=1 FL=1